MLDCQNLDSVLPADAVEDYVRERGEKPHGFSYLVTFH